MLALAIKYIILLFGLLLSLLGAAGALPVAALLTALTLTSLNGYFRSRRFTLAGSAVYLAVSAFTPAFCSFLPVFCFDLFDLKQPALSALVFIPVLTNGLEFAETSIIFMLSIMAALLRYLCDRIDRLAHDNIQIKDSSREQNRILTLQNKSLMDKQDYEIRLATLKERNRIAREIHDNVGHILSRSILQAGVLQTINKDEQLTGHLAGLKDTLSLAMNSIRGSVHDLKEDSVDLHDALTQMLELHGYEIHLDYDVSNTIPNEVKYCFITTAKEALTNITKHSDADLIRMAVREHPALYQLLIHDNGTKKPNRRSSGMGLSNMEDRVKALGGHFSADYQNGFRIFISIPKREEANP